MFHLKLYCYSIIISALQIHNFVLVCHTFPQVCTEVDQPSNVPGNILSSHDIKLSSFYFFLDRSWTFRKYLYDKKIVEDDLCQCGEVSTHCDYYFTSLDTQEWHLKNLNILPSDWLTNTFLFTSYWKIKTNSVSWNKIFKHNKLIIINFLFCELLSMFAYSRSKKKKNKEHFYLFQYKLS